MLCPQHTHRPLPKNSPLFLGMKNIYSLEINLRFWYLWYRQKIGPNIWHVKFLCFTLSKTPA